MEVDATLSSVGNELFDGETALANMNEALEFSRKAISELETRKA